MLSRSAHGLYWMGRYLERAEFVCRMLRLQTEALVDRPISEIHSGWNRIYNGLNRLPPLGSQVATSSDEFTQADSFTLADDLTFERTNPDSVWSCFSMGRENARQMRHHISGELWTSINLAYLKMQKLTITDIWATSPEGFYAETAAEMNTFSGVAGATIYRDEGWSFMQLGRFIERAQLSTSLLLTQIDADAQAGEYSEADWTSLLRLFHAVEAYNRSYSVEVQPDQVLNLLVTDALLPDSLCRSLDRAHSGIASIGSGPNVKASSAALRLAGRTGALIHYNWPDGENRPKLLRQVQQYSRELHHLLADAYFDYPIEELPAR